MAKTGVTEGQIDIYFGWHEKILLKAMQVHYAALSIRARMTLAKITGWRRHVSRETMRQRGVHRSRVRG